MAGRPGPRGKGAGGARPQPQEPGPAAPGEEYPTTLYYRESVTRQYRPAYVPCQRAVPMFKFEPVASTPAQPHTRTEAPGAGAATRAPRCRAAIRRWANSRLIVQRSHPPAPRPGLTFWGDAMSAANEPAGSAVELPRAAAGGGGAGASRGRVLPVARSKAAGPPPVSHGHSRGPSSGHRSTGTIV